MSRARADIVVVGGGVAGWTAALSAQQRGAAVVLVEKSEQVPALGNTVLSGGTFHAAYLDPTLHTAEELRTRILERAEGAVRADLVEAWAANALRARNFLAAHGAEFATAIAEYGRNTLTPQRSIGRDLIARRAWAGMGPARLVTTIAATFQTAGGLVRRGTRATELLERDGAVAGVRVESPEGTDDLAAAAVILADGGFQANAELVHHYITSDYLLRGSENDVGDGLQMGLKVGAASTNLRNFYGHAQVRDAVTNPALWPDPDAGVLGDAGIVVDGHGRRIADEWRGTGQHAAIADALAGPIAWCATPGDCWAIVTRAWWDGPGTDGHTPMNPTLLQEGASVRFADDAVQLAALTGIPEPGLAATLEEYNAYASGRAATITPPRGGSPRPLTGHLVAIPLIAGITSTMGGLLVDRCARVLREDDRRPINGLYAAGGTMGGLQGGPANRAYTGGWSEAATFGMLAGEHAATLTTRGGLYSGC
jgi:fumarate reductase flavoprotein subunit